MYKPRSILELLKGPINHAYSQNCKICTLSQSSYNRGLLSIDKVFSEWIISPILILIISKSTDMPTQGTENSTYMKIILTKNLTFINIIYHTNFQFAKMSGSLGNFSICQYKKVTTIQKIKFFSQFQKFLKSDVRSWGRSVGQATSDDI